MTGRAALDIGLAAQNVVRRDGQGRVMLELANGLLRRGHRLTVYAHRVDDDLAARVAVRPVSRFPGPQVLDDIAMLVRTTRAMRAADHEVVCVLGPCAWPRQPWVFNVQFSHAGWRRTWTPSTSPARRYRAHAAVVSRLEAWSARRADVLVASTEALAAEIVPAGTVPVAVVPNGVDAEQFQPAGPAERLAARGRLGLADDAFVVSFLGDVATTRKGLRPLLDAVAAGPDDEHLLIAAPAEPPGLYETLAPRNLLSRVHVVGFVPPEEAFAASDAVAVPSLYEPWSLVALEAAAAQLPVVLSRAAGAAAYLEGAAKIVDPGDVRGIRAALDELRADPDAARTMAAGGRAIARRLSWPAVVDSAVAVIEATAQGDPAPAERAVTGQVQ